MRNVLKISNLPSAILMEGAGEGTLQGGTIAGCSGEL